MRKALMWTAAVLAAVFVFLVATLPPAPATTTGAVDEGIRRRTLAGAYHIHSNRSDGIGDRNAIAAAAARAGLQFVIITDHGDATRAPDPPAYLHGVLCLDAVEISTDGGHYIALDMPASPYPLGGGAADVVEDVRRLGGFGIAAHPDSPKPSLQWTDWSLPIDGFEWLNLDSEWRDESNRHLARSTVDYFFRMGPALTAMLDRPNTLDRWDRSDRRVALAGHDAHGGWAHRAEDGDRQGILGIPSYEGSFRTFALRVVLEQEPSGRPDRDGRAVFDAIRAGRLFTAIDAIARPAFVDYHVEAPGMTATMGQEVQFVEGASLAFRSTVPPGGKATLLRGGEAIAESTSGELRVPVRSPKALFAVDAYRVEVSAAAAPGNPPIPWIVTNPIYVHERPAPPVVDRPFTLTKLAVIDDPGSIEKDSSSMATLARKGGVWTLQYALGLGDRAAQYAAISLPVPANLSGLDALRFTVQAATPSRVSVQLRFNSHGGARWARSLYVTPQVSEATVILQQFKPVEGISPLPPLSSASSLLFVIDLTNAKPGQKGTLQISNVAFGRLAN
jgi:hypothetical protein